VADSHASRDRRLLPSTIEPVIGRGLRGLRYGFAEVSESELDAAMEDINHRAHRSSAVLEDMLKRTTPRL
jgi:hypothetical protein